MVPLAVGTKLASRRLCVVPALRERIAEMPAVRSETPTHEPIVTLETFVQVNTLLGSRLHLTHGSW